MRPDEELLAAWSAGDAEAGETLCARHFDPIYDFFSRKVAGDVSDLVQRTFLALTEAKDGFRGEASVRTFLFVIARRELFQYFNQQRKDEVLDFAVSSLQDLAPTPSSLLHRDDERALLAESLKHIPLDMQIAIELHYWQDLSGADIARVLDVPEGTVRSRLRRGLEALRAQLERFAGERRPRWSNEDALERWAREIRPYDGEDRSGG